MIYIIPLNTLQVILETISQPIT